jgi:hypothetical protein
MLVKVSLISLGRIAMDALLMIIGLLLVVWYFGFVNSARSLANTANDSAKGLELANAERLKNRFKASDVKELKEYLKEFREA